MPQKKQFRIISHPRNKSHFQTQNQINTITNLESLGNSPINIKRLEAWLADYPEPVEKHILLEGFTFGFHIPFQGARVHRESKNHGSANSNPDLVEAILLKEVNLGRVAGPFSVLPLDNLIISPIGLVPKSTPGEMRLIFDLSYPNGLSVNEGIPKEFSSVSYTSFDAVTRMVMKEGRGCSLVKIDVKSAFRLIPIHPDDFVLMGMKVKEKIFVDKCLPFGLSASCALFEKFSTFLEWCIKKAADSDNMIHYLDDFCGGAKDHVEAQVLLTTALEVFKDIGVPVAEEKVEGPVTSLKFLGLVVDTVAMEVRIPEDKLVDLRLTLRQAIERRKMTLQEIQSLVGKLNFCCRAVAPGRAFCRRLIDATIGLRHPFHRTRVSIGMREDMLLWQKFLDHHNGITFMADQQWKDNQGLNLFTDAAGSLGFGIFFQNKWSAGQWPRQIQDAGFDITFKELFPIVLALELWGQELSNQKVIFHCDNMSVVNIINKQSSRSKPVMCLVRKLVLSCLVHNIVFKAKHIEGSKNIIADALSRFQFGRFRAVAPEADLYPTPVPEDIWTELIVKYCR